MLLSSIKEYFWYAKGRKYNRRLGDLEKAIKTIGNVNYFPLCFYGFFVCKINPLCMANGREEEWYRRWKRK